jgi:hypothetical protein
MTDGAPPDEASVAFFGAVDSRPYLFYMTVSLLSVHRFHPAAGYFALVPAGKSTAWRPFSRWLSDGHIQLLDLPPDATDNFAAPEGGASYSRFTFHRHAMPQLLARLGFAYSVNLDPDVLCTRPWDLSILSQVQLIAGRRVGSTKRTIEWLQAMVSGTCAESESAQLPNGSSRCSEEAIAARRNTAQHFLTGGSLGITPASLSQTPELNGGVLVFNNMRAVREDWLARCLGLYGHVKDIVEGDQDLLSLVLASNLTLPRAELPTVYNYAFRRDRERLPHSIGKQLRHGMFVRVAVNVHFVQDGKPWQLQNLTVYPMWLLTARAHHVHEWVRMARRHTVALDNVVWTEEEKEAFGSTLALLQSTSRPALGGVLDAEALRLCRCYLRGIAKDWKADPMLLPAAETRGSGGGGENNGGGSFFSGDTKAEGRGDRDVLFRDELFRERAALLEACSDGAPPTEREEALCTREWNVRTGSAEASTAARLAIRGLGGGHAKGKVRMLEGGELGGAAATGEVRNLKRREAGAGRSDEASTAARVAIRLGGVATTGEVWKLERRGKGVEALFTGRRDEKGNKAKGKETADVEARGNYGLGSISEAGHERRAGNATRAAKRQAHARTHERGAHAHAHAHARRAKRDRDGDARDGRAKR